MAKNIEMNWFNGSEYEVLYPYTTMELVENLQTTIDSTYENLLNTINNKGIKTTVLSRLANSVQWQTVSLVCPFTPTVMLCSGYEQANPYDRTVIGIWYGNHWCTMAKGGYGSFFKTTGTTTIQWEVQGGLSAQTLNANGWFYIFLLIS